VGFFVFCNIYLNMEKSFFENMDDKSLFRYCKYVLSKIDWDSISSINEFFDDIYGDDKTMNLLKAPIGRQLSSMDMEYLYYVLVNNSRMLDGSLDNNMVRPKLRNYSCEYESHENVFVIYTYRKNLESYLGPYDFDSDYLRTLEDHGEIDGWEWNYNDRNEIDSDVTETDYKVLGELKK